MTATTTPPVAPAASSAPAPPAPTVLTVLTVSTVSATSPRPAPQPASDLLSTGNSTTIGRLWLLCGLAFGVFSLVLAVLLGAERLTADSVDIFAGNRSHFQFFSLHKVSLVLLCAMPLFVGLANIVVPRQVGATSTAFPRLGVAAFYTWLIGAGILVASWGIDGGLVAGGGQEATELSLLSMFLVVAALTAASLNIASTIILQRAAPLRHLTSVPYFSWSMLLTGILWILSLPILLANLVLMWVDARGPTAARYGLGENLYEQVSWFFDQPQVFVFALPVLGIVSDALFPAASAPLATSATAPVTQKADTTIKLSLALIAVVSFGGDLQSFFYSDRDSSPLYALAPFLLIVFVLGLLRGWAQLKSHAKTAASPAVSAAPSAGSVAPSLLFLAIAGFLLYLGGWLLSAIRAIGPLVGGLRIFSDDPTWQQDVDDFLNPFDDLVGTSATSAVFHGVLLAAILGALAGICMWAPAIIGKKLSTATAFLSGLGLLAGTTLYAGAEMISGFFGQPELPPSPPTSFDNGDPISFASGATTGDTITSATTIQDGAEIANSFSFAGSIVVLVAVVLVVITLAVTSLLTLGVAVARRRSNSSNSTASAEPPSTPTPNN